MVPQDVLPQILLLFGLGFLAANVKAAADLVRFRWRRRSALLLWESPKPPYYGFSLGLGVVLGLLLAFKVVTAQRSFDQLFGVTMMFVYYGYIFPLSTRILKGFYRDGVWADNGFVRWDRISAVTWRDDREPVRLVLISSVRQMARQLAVPGHLYGQARRLLRDRIRAQELHMGGTGLDLGMRDEADKV
jgi:hypothetical protein